MCTCDEHDRATKRAKAWAITLIVFGVFNVLGSIQNILNPGPNFMLSGIFSLISGLMGIVCGGITTCGIPNVTQTDQQRTATKKALTISARVGMGATIAYVIAFLFGILSFLDLMNCANNPCPDFNPSGAWSPRSMPTACVKTACEEKDFPRLGWNQDADCAATWGGAAKNQEGRCTAGYNHYISQHISFGDGRPGIMTCVPRTCCSASASPPSGYVDASAFSCPATTDPNYFCGLKAICVATMPFGYGAIGWGVITGIIYHAATFFLYVAAHSEPKSVGPAI